MQIHLDKIKSRPLSWSSISSFTYNKESWARKYLLGEKDPESAEMKFGKIVGEKLASDSKYLPFVPRLNKYEHKFEVVFSDIPLIGYADGFCTKTNKKMLEYKTGREWSQQKVDNHGQVDMYLLAHFITTKTLPEDMDVKLVWLPTKRVEYGDFKVDISFVDPIEETFRIFPTKRTTADILRFGAFIKNTWTEMSNYALKYSVDKTLD